MNLLIIIRDDVGNSLYRENIKGEIFSKNFLVNTEEMGDDDHHFRNLQQEDQQECGL